MNLKENIKQAIDEVLGVPDNIVNVANQIYDEVINHIDEDENVGDFDNVYSYIKGKFKVGDLKFKNIEYVFDFKENQQDSDVGMVGMATGGSFKVTKNFKIKSTMDNNTFHIKFVLFAPKNATGKDIKEYLNKEKNEIISSITHELKHKYDDYKKPKTSLTARGEYSAYSNRGFGDITPINKFLHHLYFTHSIENLVRPSELAGSIQSGEITKKDFYNFLMDNRVYKELKKIQNFTYEGLREELRDYLDKIKFLFDMNNIEYEGLSDDEVIDRTLDLILLNLKHWKAETVQMLLADNPFEMFFGFRGKKDKYFRQYLNKVSKYDGDSKRYFKYEEKMFNMIADKMIRKISKLFAMAKDVKTESFNNQEIWLRAIGIQNMITESTQTKKSS